MNCNPTKRVDIMIQFFSGLKQFKITQQQGLGVNNSCFISLKRFPCAMLGDNCPSKIKIILLIVYTVPNVHHCYHCFKGKCCSWFEGLLSCDTLETVMHYHQNPYVRNITALHRNYEHKRQIKAIKDCFIT